MTKRTTKPPPTNTLPETLDEAEALAFARVWIGRVGGAAFFESGLGPLDPAASHWFVRRLIRLAIESSPSGAAKNFGWQRIGIVAREIAKLAGSEYQQSLDDLSGELAFGEKRWRTRPS